MRRIITRGKWLVDIVFFQRDSFSLHLFALIILKGPSYFIKVPDLKVPMSVKVFPPPRRKEPT